MKDLDQDMKAQIAYGSESRRWEFKPRMIWGRGQENKKSEIAKAALALSNISGGGFIIIGISQNRDRSGGVKYLRLGLADGQFLSFDNEDDIGRFFKERASHSIKFEVFGGEVLIPPYSKKFIAIQIYESQASIPVVCAHEYKPHAKRNSQARLIKGALYIRSISSPIESRPITTQEEWDEMVNRLLRYREEIVHRDLIAICENINKIKSKERLPQKRSADSSKKYDRFLKRDKHK